MKVKELTEWLARHDPDAEVDVEASVFPDEDGGYLDVRPIAELSEDGRDHASLSIDVYLYDVPLAVRAALREPKSGEERLVEEYVRLLIEARADHERLVAHADMDVQAAVNGLSRSWASVVSLLAAQLGIESRLIHILRPEGE
jgi:hypothetical protein